MKTTMPAPATPAATTRTGDNGDSSPSFFHAFAALWIVGLLVFARLAAEEYAAQMQEDRAVEWWTAVLFGAAGFFRLRHALSHHSAFDVLVGLFCLFVAGEEMSWGQRLLGYTPPQVFLEHNTQQEANVHNFAGVFGRPKWVLIGALVGYGLAMPLLSRMRQPRKVMSAIGATAPPLALAPWFAAAAGLLIWYPVTFTGEWVELLAGCLFLAAAVAGKTFWLTLTFGLGIALVMTYASAAGRAGEPHRITCARAEIEALLFDVTTGGAATNRLSRMGTIHKRVWTSATEGYLHWERTTHFHSAECAGEAAAESAERRRYAIDPWGTAYWIRVARSRYGERRITVYSLGPDRRRDAEPDASGGDDVTVLGTLPVP